MKKNKSKLILFLPLFTLILSVMLSLFSTFAETTYEITLELKSSTDAEVGEENVEFELWKLKGWENKNEKEVFETLKNKSNKKIKSLFGEPIKQIKTEGEPTVKISELERGIYYLRDKNHGTKKKYYSSVVFKVPESDQVKFKVKHIETTSGSSGGGNNPNEGSIRFIKVADNKKRTPLKGAKFKVTKKVGKKDETVQKDGKDYIVTSDEDGNFIVENLPYGEYYLWEVQAPEGFKSLSNSIKFTIDENSDISKSAIEIENEENPTVPPGEGKTKKPEPDKNTPGDDKPEEKDTPKKGLNIPKTGDVIFIFLLIEGTVLTAIGYFMVRSEKNKIKKNNIKHRTV